MDLRQTSSALGGGLVSSCKSRAVKRTACRVFAHNMLNGTRRSVFGEEKTDFALIFFVTMKLFKVDTNTLTSLRALC